MKKTIAALLLVFTFASAAAAVVDGRLVRIPTRESAAVPMYWVSQTNASATLVLLPGGMGGIGRLNEDGWPGSANFLIRSGKLFAEQGFNIAMVARPSDIKDLDYRVRTSEAHMEDLRNVLVEVRKLSPAPVWLVGTSRGTISAAAFAISEKSRGLVNGVVLSSSVTSFRMPGALPTQELEKITVPVLVLHHERDGCFVCQPHELPHIMKRLSNAKPVKQIVVNGGEGASGDPCEALHWHGYVGMEREAVGLISDWIRKPVP